jgi:Putative amidase domain
VQSCMNAIRAYFEAKNQVWVTRDVDALLRAGGSLHGVKWARELGANIEAKARSMQNRHSRLLRAHSKVAIHRLDSSNLGGTEKVRVDERVTWVYADGDDYGVEARVIQHRQKWLYRSGVWMLVSAKESSESHPVLDEDTDFAPAVHTNPTHLDLTGRKNCVSYDRVRALRYAELWWDGWNSDFPKLADDCTNFISQCLFAGRMPMRGQGNRRTGWWYRFGAPKSSEAWSYSWGTTHALQQYLTSKMGATVIRDPQELKIGDLIFYDWKGNGRYHHATIVVDFDREGNPLVNAHTDSSYHRHYLYLDSRAWTPRTRYQFVHLPDQFC